MPGDEELVVQKPIYQEEYRHHTWASEASKYEQEFARRLYDSELVRTAGKTALSKVSTLLVRYNRLKEIEETSTAYMGKDRRKADRNYASDKKTIEDEIAELEKNPIDEEEDEKEREKKQKARDKELARLRSELEKVEKKYKERKEVIEKKVEKMEEDALRTELNPEAADKDGKVLSSLMLAGTGEGARGYTLTEGGYADFRKGADYISEVQGDQGSLFDQMALLDSAVNTEGMQTPDGKSPLSLGRVLRDVSEKDIEKMNRGSGADIGVNMGLINKARENDGFYQYIGGGHLKRTMGDIAKERGQSEEGKLRQAGKMGVNAQRKMTDAEKAVIAPLSTNLPTLASRFFGEAGSFFTRRKGSRDNDANRDAIRKEAAEFFELYGLDLDDPDNDGGVYYEAKQEAPEIRANESDTSAEMDKKLGSKDALAAEALSREGFLRTISGKKEELDTEELTEQAITEASREKSARNILWAYNMMGASKDELLKLRLALIAYMVPTGRKTMFEIINESSGIEGMMDGIDISEPGLMYKTFATSTAASLGEDVTSEIKVEPKPRKIEDMPEIDEDIEVIDDVEAEAKIVREGLRLPTDAVKANVAKEKAEKKEKEKAEARKKAAKKRKTKRNVEDRKRTGDYIDAFGDISAQVDDIFTGEDNNENAVKLSAALCKALKEGDGTEKLKNIVAIMSGKIEGAEPNAFWLSFFDQFARLYIMEFMGPASGGQYREKIEECIRILKEKDSEFKQLVVTMFLQAGGV